MAARLPRVFTIPPDESFLEVLARAVLDGFPGEAKVRPSPFQLARTRILLPTRRAARELERVFYSLSGDAGLLLPNISPIGDVAEELFETSAADRIAESLLPPAISPVGRDLLVFDLIEEWARANVQSSLASEILASPRQALALALSLAEFIDGLETEEIPPAGITGLFGLESARHREAILDFLSVARERLPARLHDLAVISPAARRSLVLRSEAARLIDNPPDYPVIAAGSTGSITATRHLLKTISMLPAGAIVLPGIDMQMSDQSWQAIGPQHPQFALKQLLSHLLVTRAEVTEIPPSARRQRSWLAGEIMRPTETTPQWGAVVRDSRPDLEQALQSIHLLQAEHIHHEAKTIALILRQFLDSPRATASLVTPDRDLARRVKRELQILGIEIDDSAGEPLIRFDGAALLGQLIDAALEGFSPGNLMALLKQNLWCFSLPAEQARRAISVLEIAVFRTTHHGAPIETLVDALHAARQSIDAADHPHPALQALDHDDWQAAETMAQSISACLLDLPIGKEASLCSHLDGLIECCEQAAGERFWQGESARTLWALIETLRRDAVHLPSCSFDRAAVIVRHYLATTPFRQDVGSQSRLSILGLLEARLSKPDRIVLGGLNEGRWPALPDSGPWLNRPMRDILGLQQPERQIGQTAHDLVQALGCDEVFLVWSRRVGDAPAVPSRWILRLQMLIKAAGLEHQLGATSQWTALASKLQPPAMTGPCRRPRPMPPRHARPKRLSVTRIETLIRDPYAIYAAEVLGLQPLDDLSATPDMALRGTLFHRAIGDFLARYPGTLPPEALDYLLERGRHHLAQFSAFPDIGTFWAAQFERIARWLFAEEQRQRQAVTRVFAEIGGKLTITAAGEPFILSCRADRIDVLENGLARIVDYKTGRVPSTTQVITGLAPQLTLQAAMLESGAFAATGPMLTQDIAYVKLGIGDVPGDVIMPDLKQPLMDCARQHMAGLVSLLTSYADERQAYFPRTMVETEDEERPFDHLARFREWALSGEGQ